MGFETPLALLALFAAGLPILAHLLRRQDLPLVNLPTVKLLERAVASNQRRVRLVDLLLLLLRMLMIAAVAAAVAGPFLRLTLSYGDGSVASLAIVIDDSMSVDGRGLRGLAAERAREVIESLPEGSEVAVILGGRPARVLTGRTDDLRTAEDAVTFARGEAHGTDLESALRLAEHELAGARHANRRVLVLTDGAAHANAADLTARGAIALEIETLAASPEVRNVAVTETRAIPDPTGPGLTSVEVLLRASPDLAGESVEVRLLDGSENVLAHEQVELLADGARVHLRARVPSDDPRGSVTVELDDAIAADNRRGVLLRPRAATRVVLVDGDPQPVGGEDEVRFVASALDLAPSDETHGNAITRRTVDADTFDTLDLSETDVVVLANVPTPSAATVASLRAFVSRGGGLLIAPGDHFDPREAAAAYGDLLPARTEVAAQSEVQGPRLDPAAQWVEGSDGLEAAVTRQRLTFDERPMQSSAPLRFGDGAAALLLTRYEAGQVALLATTLDDGWTDLPFQPGYLPFVITTVRRLAPSSGMPDHPFFPGETVVLTPPAGATRISVSTPDRRALEFDGAELEGPISIRDTEAPGVYRVEVGTATQALHTVPALAFLVAPPAEESDLSPGRSVRGHDEPDAVRGASAPVTVERPFAHWLYLLAGILAVAEAIVRVRRRPKRTEGRGSAALSKRPAPHA